MVLDTIKEDVRTARTKDPAARSAVTVALLYSGIHAVWGYRLAHALWNRGHCFSARFGASATLLGDIVVGEAASVGAGSVVVEDVPPGVTVTGVPAEPTEEPTRMRQQGSG